jgi:hypothetical protein
MQSWFLPVKLQSVVGLIGPMLVFTEVDQTLKRINIGTDLDQETITELNK